MGENGALKRLWWLIPDVYHAPDGWGYAFCGVISVGHPTRASAYRKAYRRWITSYLWGIIRSEVEYWQWRLTDGR